MGEMGGGRGEFKKRMSLFGSFQNAEFRHEAKKKKKKKKEVSPIPLGNDPDVNAEMKTTHTQL